MKPAWVLALAPFLLALPAFAGESPGGVAAIDALDDWPQWRGPLGSGAAPHADPPVRWSEGENVRWKTRLPGLGHSTPIVWGERIFLTTAVAHGAELEAPEEHDHGAHHTS